MDFIKMVNFEHQVSILTDKASESSRFVKIRSENNKIQHANACLIKASVILGAITFITFIIK